MNSPIKKIDLSAIKDDKSSSLHKSLKTRIAVDGLVANVIVIDLDQVYLPQRRDVHQSRGQQIRSFHGQRSRHFGCWQVR
jgi:hypothetical protein